MNKAPTKKELQATIDSLSRSTSFLELGRQEALGWLKLGLTHKIWGSVEDAYAALEGGAPPVKAWRKEFRSRMGGLRNKARPKTKRAR